MEGADHRRRAQRILIVTALVAGAGIFLYWRFASVITLQQVLKVQQVVQDAVVAPEPEKPISKPPPLRTKEVTAPAPSPTPSAPSGTGTPTTPSVSVGAASDKYALTRAGILAQTNIARAESGGLPPLKGNAVLDAIAVGRLEDMFAKQYFEHVAPDGGKAETVAKTVGYEFIALGENLALGNYDGDAGVVTAWMESPGHRANILNDGYTELGVAARKGMFEGHNTWLAVQIFARPASDCPAPDKALKAEIDSEQATLQTMEDELNAKKAELETMQPKRGPAYNQKVAEYNALVEQYNALIAEIKGEIAAYNDMVASFNACIAS